MPKKILLIENDSAFAGTLSESLEASGFDVRVAAEGKAGLDLAREWSPDGIVLCVELPGMSGYLVCQKLRKDDATKAIPLILTSAEATADTFEKHKALKVRADAYQLKPFVPGDLLERLTELGLPAEIETPNTTDEISLQPAGPDDLPSLELEALPDADEPPAAAPPANVDDDLAFLDEAFEGISAPTAARPAPEAPVEEEDLSAAAASLPSEEETAGRAALEGLALSDEDPLAQLDEGASPPEPAAEPEPEPEPAPAPRAAPRAAPVRSPSADVLRAAGIPLLDDERASRAAPSRSTLVGMQPVTPVRAPAAAPPPAAPAARAADNLAADRLQRELSDARAALASRDVELRHLRSQAEEAGQRADAAESAAAEREAELASVRARLEAVAGQAKRTDQDLRTARDEGHRAVAELESVRARIEELERELESTRTELVVARGEAEGARNEAEGARSEAEGARNEIEARTAELNKRIAELEGQSTKNEERIFKAYQKIKGDEKVKDKVRKALAIAAQLLEEGLPAEPAPAEKSKVS